MVLHVQFSCPPCPQAWSESLPPPQCLIALEFTLTVLFTTHPTLRPVSCLSVFLVLCPLPSPCPIHEEGACLAGGVPKCSQEEASHCLAGLAWDIAGCSRPAPCPHCHLVQPQCCHGNQDPSRDGCGEGRKNGERTQSACATVLSRPSSAQSWTGR